MEKDQVSLIKSISLSDDGTGKPLASSLTTVFDDEVAFRNTDDFVIWDDENELVHAIKANSDSPRSSADSPYKLITGFYGNIQFMEGLYNMTNFKKVVDELFVKTGLINEEKKNMIFEWAANIRNIANVPKSPGPYYDSVPLVPPHPSVPEVRSDGRIHANPIDQRTKMNKLYALIDPIIEADENFVQRGTSRRYDVTVIDMQAIANTIENAVKAVGTDIFRAEFSSFEKAAVYDPKDEKSVASFNANVVEVLPHAMGAVFGCKLHVEAFGIGVIYDFRIAKNSNPEDDKKWIDETEESINNFLELVSDDAITSLSVNDRKIDAVINSTEIGDIGLPEFLGDIDKLSKATVTANGKTFTLIPGDTESYNNFWKGVLSIMPDSNNGVVNGALNVESATAATLQYVFRVRYWNEAECETYINRDGTIIYVNTLIEAVALAQSGDEIVLQHDVAVPAGNILTIDGAREITVNMNNKNITFADKTSYFLAQGGTLNLTGTGTLSNPQTYPVCVKGTAAGEAKSIVNTGSGITLSAVYGLIVSRRESQSQNFNVEVNMTGTKVDVLSNGFGVYVNGTVQNLEGAIPVLRLTDVVISDKSPNKVGEAIYGAGFAKWILNNVTAEGTTTVSAKSGIFEINGGKFTAYGEYKDPADGNNDGSEETGAALSLTSNDGYAKSLTVTVNGGEFVSQNGHALYEGIAQKGGKPVAAASYVVLSVTGGKFNGGDGKAAVNISAAANKKVITGGSFNTDVVDFVASGYKTDFNASTGYYDVVPGTEEAVVDEEIHDIIDNLDNESVTIDPVAGGDPNEYLVSTSVPNAITTTGIIDDILALTGVSGLEASDGITTVSYATGGDLAAFKAAIDDMCPTANVDDEATITLKVIVD